MRVHWLQKICVIVLRLTLFMTCQRGDSLETEEINYPSKSANKGSKLQTLRLQLAEPGFNLTEEEMIKFKIWPKGIIPYFIDDYSFDSTLKYKIRLLMNSFNSVTGLAFSEITSPPVDADERWVFFINRRGLLSCEDYTTNSFTNTGVQRVVLGYNCLDAGGGALASTVLALAGVPPQHNAPDRDKHIDVIMDNIIPEKRQLFQVLKNNEWLFHHVPYDFLSAGHYEFHKYTINGSATIRPKKQAYIKIPVGEDDGISLRDIWKIRMLYNYISLTRKNRKASDCSQLFKPGLNFSHFKPERKDILIARKKPRKYLGLSEEEPPYVESDQTSDLSPEVKEKPKLKGMTTLAGKNLLSPLDSDIEVTDRPHERYKGWIKKKKLKHKYNKAWKKTKLLLMEEEELPHNRKKKLLSLIELNPDRDTDYDNLR